MLTNKQRDLLLLIHDRMSKTSVAPSFEEMKEAIGLKSKSSVHRLISALEEKGFLRKIPQRARAIEVKKLPEQLAPLKNVRPDRSSMGEIPRADQ